MVVNAADGEGDIREQIAFNEQTIAAHDVADVGSNCRECGEGQPYPCDIRMDAERAVARAQERLVS